MEDKLHRDSARGARAANLLEHELLKEAHEKIEEQLIQAWINSDPRDTEGRERVFASVHANRKHRDYLKTVAMDGKLAQAQLRDIVEASERKRGIFNR